LIDGEAVVWLRVSTTNPNEAEVRLETHWFEDEGQPVPYSGYQV
jgi:hypothetical protein